MKKKILLVCNLIDQVKIWFDLKKIQNNIVLL